MIPLEGSRGPLRRPEDPSGTPRGRGDPLRGQWVPKDAPRETFRVLHCLLCLVGYINQNPRYRRWHTDQPQYLHVAWIKYGHHWKPPLYLWEKWNDFIRLKLFSYSVEFEAAEHNICLTQLSFLPAIPPLNAFYISSCNSIKHLRNVPQYNLVQLNLN